ncbi:glycosyltransferase [Candidatus Pelagibacter bacterium]|nr:glycosyltransferase family 2 protein [Candidatus Pelagibacter bacterium]MDA8801448.1 glycosyltransferase [Candidatus Pelagibacter bacterium]
MIEQKTISTVIPTFNREIYLKEAILSCLNQSIKHEIIVCNHGGTDGTDIMVKKFEDKIKYIKNTKDYGPHFCWLQGVMEAKGEYINLLFDDDWIEPKFIEECMKYFADEDIGFVFSATKVFDDKSKKITQYLHKILPTSGVYNISKHEPYFVQNLISPTSLIIRKKDMIDSLFQGKLPFAKFEYKGVGPDKLMIMMCMLRYKKFGYVSEYLSAYRSHENSITIDGISDNQKEQNFRKAYREVNFYYYTLKYAKYFLYLVYIKDFCNRLINKIINLLK